MAASILARLMKSIQVALNQEFKLDADTQCWTDSTVVWHWFMKSHDRKQFVSTRIGEIKELLPHATLSQWPGESDRCGFQSNFATALDAEHRLVTRTSLVERGMPSS